MKVSVESFIIIRPYFTGHSLSNTQPYEQQPNFFIIDAKMLCYCLIHKLQSLETWATTSYKRRVFCTARCNVCSVQW